MTTSQTPANPTFQQFVDTLHDAGWRSSCDAQHDNARKLHAEWFAASPSPELPAERARLVEEAKREAHTMMTDSWATGDERAYHPARDRFHAVLEQIAALPAPTPASVQPVAVRWEALFWPEDEDGWIRTDLEGVEMARKNNLPVRALGVIDPTPAESGKPLAQGWDVDDLLDKRAPQAGAAEGWQPIETAPKTGLVDVWTAHGRRYAECYYDAICGEWRTIQAGTLICLRGDARALYWMPVPAAPGAATLMANGPAETRECRDPMCACRGGPCAECPDGATEARKAGCPNRFTCAGRCSGDRCAQIIADESRASASVATAEPVTKAWCVNAAQAEIESGVDAIGAGAASVAGLAGAVGVEAAGGSAEWCAAQVAEAQRPKCVAPNECGFAVDLQQFAERVREGIADFVGDNWPIRKHALAEIEIGIRAIEVNASILAAKAASTRAGEC